MCNVPSQSDLKAFWSQESPEGTYIYFDFFHADRHLHEKKQQKNKQTILMFDMVIQLFGTSFMQFMVPWLTEIAFYKLIRTFENN